MLKEAISKFGEVEEGTKEANMKEYYILKMAGLNQKDEVCIEVILDDSDLVTITNKHYPIDLVEGKEEALGKLFDEEYTIVIEDDSYIYKVNTKGTYFPSVYLEDIRSYYKNIIDAFGSL